MFQFLKILEEDINDLVSECAILFCVEDNVNNEMAELPEAMVNLATRHRQTVNTLATHTARAL